MWIMQLTGFEQVVKITGIPSGLAPRPCFASISLAVIQRRSHSRAASILSGF
jgi:hypothetical protein